MRHTERATIGALYVTGLLELAYWVVFCTMGMAPLRPPQCYFAYERAFLVPDVLVALAMIAAATLRLRRHPFGRPLTVACGGSLAFLGLLDASFNVQNGVYASSTLDLWTNAGLNLYCVAFGATLVLATARAQRSEMVSTDV